MADKGFNSVIVNLVQYVLMCLIHSYLAITC